LAVIANIRSSASGCCTFDATLNVGAPWVISGFEAAATASIVLNDAADTAAIGSTAFDLYTALKAKMVVRAC
jgi:hypothetical protein